MKSLFIFVVAGTLLFGYQNCRHTSQQEDSEKQSYFDYSAADCTYQKTTRKPATTFPFSVADKIEVVSFKQGMTEMIDRRFLILDLQERARLNKPQTDSMFSILYDYGYQKPESRSTFADCYAPHHAILFYQRNKAVAFLEICFICSNTRTSDEVNFGEFCQGKVQLIKRFVKQTGIRYDLSGYRP